nr:hypothetical transcript [Hymenolepis microstoma]
MYLLLFILRSPLSFLLRRCSIAPKPYHLVFRTLAHLLLKDSLDHMAGVWWMVDEEAREARESLDIRGFGRELKDSVVSSSNSLYRNPNINLHHSPPHDISVPLSAVFNGSEALAFRPSPRRVSALKGEGTNKEESLLSTC